MGKLIDLTGQTFEDWQVIERDYDNKTTETHWKCRCIFCGMEKSISGSSLRRGLSKYCQCRNDLSGQKFGRWTVLNKDPNDSTRYICKCECGTVKSILRQTLKKGATLSCGCLRNEQQSKERAIDLTGQKFGRLTVIKRYEGQDKKQAYWECKCDCGNPNIKIVRGSHLRSGDVKTCGVCTNWTEEFFHPEQHDFLERLDYDFKTKKWNVKCKACGSITQMTHDNFKRNKSCGCIKSHGEFSIAQILNQNNISFEKEKTFTNFKTPNNIHYRFDFYVNDEYIIEFDGIQHFNSNAGWGKETLENIQKRDALKNKYCKDNNIPLIRIPYTHLDKICLEDLLLKTSKFIV